MLVVMSRQIAIRLPDELVGPSTNWCVTAAAAVRPWSRARSRPTAVAASAERDAEILTRTGDYPDFEHLVADLDLDDLD